MSDEWGEIPTIEVSWPQMFAAQDPKYVITGHDGLLSCEGFAESDLQYVHRGVKVWRRRPTQ